MAHTNNGSSLTPPTLSYVACTTIMAHVPPYIYIYICYWRASEASETLSGVYKFQLVRYVYIYIYIYEYIYIFMIYTIEAGMDTS